MSSDNLVEVVEVVGRDTSVNLDDPIQHFLPRTASIPNLQLDTTGLKG